MGLCLRRAVQHWGTKAPTTIHPAPPHRHRHHTAGSFTSYPAPPLHTITATTAGVATIVPPTHLRPSATLLHCHQCSAAYSLLPATVHSTTSPVSTTSRHSHHHPDSAAPQPPPSPPHLYHLNHCTLQLHPYAITTLSTTSTVPFMPPPPLSLPRCRYPPPSHLLHRQEAPPTTPPQSCRPTTMHDTGLHVYHPPLIHSSPEVHHAVPHGNFPPPSLSSLPSPFSWATTPSQTPATMFTSENHPESYPRASLWGSRRHWENDTFSCTAEGEQKKRKCCIPIVNKLYGVQEEQKKNQK